MAQRNTMHYNFWTMVRQGLIISPLILFGVYLHVQYKINNIELILFVMVTALPLIVMLRYFQKEMKILARIASLQTNDSKATKKNQLLLMNIMEKMSDPILILDSRNRIVMANKSAHDLLGNQILKQEISVFIRNSNLEETLTKAHETGSSENFELKFGTPATRDYLTRIHRFSLDNDQTGHAAKHYLFLGLYDVSAIKRADKMRVDFVANASHELRTPLASILGFVETLQGPAREDEEAHERFLAIMYDEASRMSRLIEDLLSLSRIERDEHIPPSDHVTLALLIQNVIKVLEPQARDKGMTISFSPDTETEIIGDHDQLTQVFQNLIENAIKYGREQTDIKVAFDQSMMPPPLQSRETTITISNEGPGIAAQHLPRLMERFYRVDSARSRSLGGTGLGLAIVKHIIQRHSGRIFFESEINATTTVTVSLPLEPQRPPALS